MLNHLKNRPLVLAFLAVTALILFLKLCFKIFYSL